MMGGMDDLATWLRAQWDDDERVAQACIDAAGPERQGEPFTDGSGTAERDAFPSYPWGNLDAELTFMQGPGHPARVLAEVDAKRRILDEHKPYDRSFWRTDAEHLPQVCSTCYDRATHDDVFVPCPTIRLLFLPYADRPGYREEWRP